MKNDTRRGKAIIGRRVIAREWLYFAACLGWGILWAFYSLNNPDTIDLSEPLLSATLGTYVPLTVIRITVWAARTVRRAKREDGIDANDRRNTSVVASTQGPANRTR